MKTFFKFLGVLAILLVVVVAGAMTYVKTMLPDVGPAPELTVERTPERVARGEPRKSYHAVYGLPCCARL
jgi:uncharacterized membrane protein